MSYDLEQTIAAIASAPGGAARGVVRISGPDAIARVASCFDPTDASVPLAEIRTPRRIAGSINVDGDNGQPPLAIPGRLLLWPSSRSYTRQPSAEFHTIGSPPLLAAIVEQLGRVGVRPAEPGEFTLRAFLAGRIDLTQAEAVLGVIDARSRGDLDAALDQLAGGLSRPLYQLREDLLALLAELEAGLDFAEEDIEFISRDALRDRLARACEIVAGALAQIATRDSRSELPRVAIIGPPNVGKSSLFNALLERYGAKYAAGAIVSPQPGATRDYVVGRVTLAGAPCELIDTAGEDDTRDGQLHHAAQQATTAQQKQADLRLRCVDGSTTNDLQVADRRGATGSASAEPQTRWNSALAASVAHGEHDVIVLTKTDLAGPDVVGAGLVGTQSVIRCSSVTGAGIDELVRRLAIQLAGVGHDSSGQAAAATAVRCTGSLREAERALQAAAELIDAGGEELVAAEIRAALNSLGEVIGAICTDDVLDRVFSQFCIGK